MGLTRRAESRAEKGAKQLHVQPAELARKLVKEMEDHKVLRPTHAFVCDRYTIFLCPEDYELLKGRQEQIVAKLEHHLFKHVQAKRYEASGGITVAMVTDPDLKPGRFGILAEKTGPEPTDMAVMRGPAATPAASSATAPADRSGPGPAKRPSVVRSKPGGGSTKIIPAGEAAGMGLARQTIVLRSGEQVREFSRGRVVIGRARDVDFRVDDPNVSRRHAAVYWAEGHMVIEDLESTNGTMVNGYPVTNSVLRPNDVVVVGECRITVDTR